jgi:glucose/arabinose dehydrogenase
MSKVIRCAPGLGVAVHGRPRAGRGIGRAVAVLVLLLAGMQLTTASAPAAVPPGFQEQTAFSGLTQPTVVKFASDGRVFVAEKSGLVKVFDSLSDPSATTFVDLRTKVHNFWDRGLLGMVLHPDFPATPNVYVLYAHDAAIGGTAPRWGTAGATSDPCPTPPGPTDNGCVVSARLSKLTASGNTATGEQVLVEGWCQQYPSHSIGALHFGPDGMLYASGGDGASFTFVDYGQDGGSAGGANPCGDPPGAAGTALSPPTAEGGALRSQDLRTRSAGDPVGLNGTIIRIDPDTGAGAPGNPLASDADANARRIVAYGLRNPFRIINRPSTNEIWIGDVGAGTWEEIDRLVAPTGSGAGAVDNFGWPCYEGAPPGFNGRNSGFDNANLNICESLYTSGTALAPFFAYRHDARVFTGDTCPLGSSSIAGLSFDFGTGGTYPSEYQGALFFADYSRDCIWVMTRGTNGLPNLGGIRQFVAPAANPVNLEIGPAGELYYPDFDGGRIQRVRYTGASVTCPDGQFKAEYFTGVTPGTTPTFARCEATVQQNWGTGGPGNGVPDDGFSARWTGTHQFAAGTYAFTARSDDGIRVWVDDQLLIDNWRTGPAETKTASRAMTAGNHDVKVEYFDATGNAEASLSWSNANAAPTPVIDTPSATTTWKVGDTISFSGRATDPEDGDLPGSSLKWAIVMKHCPSNCHEHPIETRDGASGSFVAPDHEYPSQIALRLTATDSGGRTSDPVERLLDPQTVVLTFASVPAGLQLDVNGSSSTAPFTRTVIIGSSNSVSATTPQTLAGTSYAYSSWSDGGGQTHNITAPATPTTYTATYTPAPGGTFTPYAKVNFQPAAAPTVTGYVPDSGGSYGPRNGFTYGWNADIGAQTRDRNSSSSPDQRYDTLIHTQRGGTYSWGISVPNGTYRVRVVAGDASYFDSVYKVAVEGTLAINQTPTSAARWVDRTVVVNVSDTRLTISNAAGASNNKHCFVTIDRQV